MSTDCVSPEPSGATKRTFTTNETVFCPFSFLSFLSIYFYKALPSRILTSGTDCLLCLSTQESTSLDVSRPSAKQHRMWAPTSGIWYPTNSCKACPGSWSWSCQWWYAPLIGKAISKGHEKLRTNIWKTRRLRETRIWPHEKNKQSTARRR
jgi:hypothetical protein